MAMHLIDRPFLDPTAASHRAGGTALSVALHCTILLTLIAIMRAVPEDALSRPDPPIIVPPFVWLAPAADAGGKSGGPERKTTPPRRVQAVGHDAASVPAPVDTTTTAITNNPPEDLPSIPAQPMGDSLTPLAGAIDGQPASNATGGGPSGGGLGDKPGKGFGDGAARGAGVTTPTLLLQVKPRYTADAMRMRIQGSVWVECVVMPDGTVGDARIMRSLDAKFGLDEEAIAAAKQWRFRPGTLNGRAVPVVVTIQLDFSVR